MTNRIIYNLAKQAGLIEFEPIPGSDAVTPNYTSVVKAQKFAELLVRECMVICGAIQGAGELKNMPDFASGAEKCKAIIKRDFGVEE